MKFCAVAAVLLVSIFATSMALPARFAYYQQPSFYYQARATPQRLMYLQYVQQPSSSQANARLTNTAAAFVAGETVATGTYLKDDASSEQQIAAESILDNTGANGAQSVAEAYPVELEEPQDDGDLDSGAADAETPEIAESPAPAADNQLLENEIAPVAEDLPSQETAKEGREYSEESPAEDVPEPAVSYSAEPAVPEVPESSAVEIPEGAENDDDSDSDEDSYVPSVSRRVGAPKAAPAPAPAPLPAGSFFSIDFGGATDGATAIANSFSTGVSGSAKSQAIAYGKQEPARTKSIPIRRH